MAVIDERHSIRIVFGTEGNTRSETQNFLKPTATDAQVEEFVTRLSQLINDPLYTSFRIVRKRYG
ncbi:MAG: hypothetical protein QMD25_00080 [Caldisericia bacterium]|jgi:hypothetical protein|nr:hypothetical protein [Caldisericia bacterium]